MTQASEPTQSVHLEVRRGTAWVTVETDRPGNNMTTADYLQLRDQLRAATSNRDVRVAVLTGKPEFSVGGDWARHRERDSADFREHLGLLMEISMIVRTMGKPLIAAVRGRCTGGMHQLALLADLTIASENASFGQHGCKTGSFPAFWGTQLLPLAVGEKKAREIVFMSWEYTAVEALSMGLCNRVVPDQELEEEVLRWCLRLLEMSPRSLRFAKTSLNHNSDLNWSGVWEAREALAEFAGTPEWERSIATYLEEGGSAEAEA